MSWMEYLDPRVQIMPYRKQHQTTLEDVASILRQNVYVINMLKSFSSIKEAIRIIGKVKELCKEGFNLTKFSSNNLDALKTI